MFIALNFVVLFFVLRDLWRKKWRNRFIKWGQKTLERVAKSFYRFLERFFEKLGLTSIYGKNTIGGKISVTVDKNVFERKEEKKQKTLRWKQMKNNRDRLGFLYKYMIVNRMKRGKQAFASDTPSEIRDRYVIDDAEKKLFDTYIDTRYDERCKLSDELIESIKKDIEKQY